MPSLHGYILKERVEYLEENAVILEISEIHIPLHFDRGNHHIAGIGDEFLVDFVVRQKGAEDTLQVALIVALLEEGFQADAGQVNH
jgi:hypothetical protein